MKQIINMPRILASKRNIFAFFPFLVQKSNPYDNVKTDEDVAIENLTGFQRLRKMFESNQENFIHPALVSIGQNTFAAFLAGGIWGAVKDSRYAFINFIENNEATQFLNQHDAKRRLMDRMFTNFYKGFMTQGFKVSFFCSTFVTTYTVLAIYNNNDRVWYYSVGGAVAGAVYKFPLGPKGMVAGAVFGCFFGTLGGSLKWILMKLTNLSEEHLRQIGLEARMVRVNAKAKLMKDWRLSDEEKEIMEAMKGSKD